MGTRPSTHNLGTAISESELRELYVAQGLTIEKVAAKFGLAATTVRRRMRGLGIEARPRGPAPRTRRGGLPTGCQHDHDWTNEVAYAVGLIATDGCLGHRAGQLSLTSKDVALLETAARCLGVRARITRSTNPRPVYRLQWCDVLFHRWLMGIGLTPAKSLTLGPLSIPDEYFVHFFRGCIDGDGSIVTYVDRYNTFKNPAYVYRRLFVSIVSASKRLPTWLRATVQRLIGVTGHLTVKRAAGKNDIWCLRYAKGESLRLLRWMYDVVDVPCLSRKRGIAAPFLTPGELAARHGPGRPMVR